MWAASRILGSGKYSISIPTTQLLSLSKRALFLTKGAIFHQWKHNVHQNGITKLQMFHQLSEMVPLMKRGQPSIMLIRNASSLLYTTSYTKDLVKLQNIPKNVRKTSEENFRKGILEQYKSLTSSPVQTCCLTNLSVT